MTEKTEDLIAEARRQVEWAKKENGDVYGPYLVIRRFADALETVRENYREALISRAVDAAVAEAERDAALAAIERIRQAVSGHPECDRYEERAAAAKLHFSD